MKEDYGASSDVTGAHALIFYYQYHNSTVDSRWARDSCLLVELATQFSNFRGLWMTEFAELILNKLGLFLPWKETFVWRRLSQNCVHCMNMKRFNLLSLQNIFHELIKSTSSRFNSERSEGSFTWQVWSRVLFEFESWGGIPGKWELFDSGNFNFHSFARLQQHASNFY